MLWYVLCMYRIYDVCMVCDIYECMVCAKYVRYALHMHGMHSNDYKALYMETHQLSDGLMDILIIHKSQYVYILIT